MIPFSPALLILLLQHEKIMIIHEEYENLKLVDPFVTIGVFDGVHLGHRALLDHLASRAMKAGGESIVITFNPHPRLVLSEKTEGISFLSTLDEKKRLLAKSIIDHLIILNFTRELSNLEAVDFIREILVGRIGVKHLIIGYDNHFGKNKGGDFNRIRECAGFFDFEVEQVEGISSSEGIISSTAIRDALLKGYLEDANGWLGYNYSLTGTVVQGRKLGRLVGFPTANIKPADIYKLIPADGVYAVEVLFDNKQLPGMLSIGFNPTVNKGESRRSVEVHIFNFDMDLYDQTITIIFRYRLRDEVKFENVRLLAEQMKLDKQKAMRLLA
jgi:riboflavin kinase / FMN adenylyltransferase